MGRLWHGLLAGAAGATALNVISYLDMAVRGRRPSQTPQQSAERVASLLHVELGDEQPASNRRAGLGPLLGYLTSFGSAAVYAAVTPSRPRWPVATGALTVIGMVGASGPMTLLKVTSPRQWSATDWATDIVGHLAYGAVAAATYQALRAGGPDVSRDARR